MRTSAIGARAALMTGDLTGFTLYSLGFDMKARNLNNRIRDNVRQARKTLGYVPRELMAQAAASRAAVRQSLSKREGVAS